MNKALILTSYAMYMFGGINIVLFAYVWFLIPETNGVSLEHMDHLFGGIDHTDKGAEMLGAKEGVKVNENVTVETEERVVDDQPGTGEKENKAATSK